VVVVGRDEEISELADAIQSTSLVTVCGAPGVGKSRLVAEATGGLERQVWWCDLNDARDVALLCSTVLEVAGESGDRSPSGDDVARIGYLLHQRTPVLVLDGFDRLVHAGARVVRAWLDAAPGLVVVITSRERLRLTSEYVIDLAPLALDSAVALFDVRAAAVRTNWSPQDQRNAVGDLVERLDRLPLAIELAAARMAVIGPHDLLAELDEGSVALADAPRDSLPHHASLEHAIHASWQGLSSREQNVLAQASVFHGGFSLAAARAVIDVAGSPPLLEVLQQLRLKSLLRALDTPRGPARFSLYETVRRYAQRQLQATGSSNAVRDLHALFFARPSGDWLEADLVDIVGVAEERATDDPARSLLAVLAAEPLLWRRGRSDEIVRLFNQVLDVDGPRLAADERARGLELRGRAHRVLAHTDAARADLETALATWTDRDDQAGRGRSLHQLATLAFFRGDHAEARDRYQAAAVAHRATGDRLGEATALDGVAGAMYQAGEDVAAAQELALDALRIVRAIGERSKEAIVRGHLGLFALERGMSDEAEAQFRAALAIHRELGHVRFEAAETANLALLSQEEGRLAQAAAELDEAVRLQRCAGDIRGVALTLLDLGACHEEAGDPALATSAYVEAADSSRVVGDTRIIGIALAYRGRVAARRGDVPAASRLFAEVDAVLESNPNPELTALLAICRGHLPGAAEIDPVPYDSIAVRCALRVLRQEQSPALRLDRRHHSFCVGGGAEVGLVERPTLWRTLLCLGEHALASPGEAVSREVIFAAGWPDESISVKSAAGRVRSAVYALRKLGLSGVLTSSNEGYAVDPNVRVSVD